MSKKILVIEDEKNLARFVSLELQHEGYQVTVISNGRTGLDVALDKDFDLVLLDLLLPEMDGFEITRRLQAEKTTYVMMMTARDSVMDIVAGLDRGADDYIIKPYNPNILLLRIGAVLKRIKTNYGANSNKLSYRDLLFDVQKGIIKKDSIEIVLTKNEMIIFSYLLSHKNKIVTRDELMTTLWDNTEFVNDNALTVNISRLRNKLKEIGYEDAIDTRKGQGYILS